MNLSNQFTGLLILTLSPLFFFAQCGTEENGVLFESHERSVPEFSADSAFAFIEEQLAFGPRTPNSEGHRLTKQYLEDRMRTYAGRQNVFVQSFQVQGYSEELQLYNIISSFNPSNPERILLAAHWDTRPRAEEDPFQPDEPMIGADDGASGVAVLLELARLFSENSPPVGVDIIFFDGEDYGYSGDLANFFLGSRYWGENPPVEGYNPKFGVLLDMVGAVNARFPKERNSMSYAPEVMDAVWKIAAETGYGAYFPNEPGSVISDDHVIVHRLTEIPMIDIINHNSSSRGRDIFPAYWHSHSDNLENIDPNTLKAVGDVMTELLYNRIR